ncbi:hypothetical protein ASC97_03005 [Rhizobium sp. Root1203]|uniref:hypothetical protein n=1 Tax=Rhizobium sp. Root1203 TaxID=1736427 RepID=UPI00070FEFA0|nr:hypothetical protein [Rhizobium sp. Root1203]KQV32553.1 hypothetical protein ASC97_03005 [Rhizobium sp. Root1203]
MPLYRNDHGGKKPTARDKPEAAIENRPPELEQSAGSAVPRALAFGRALRGRGCQTWSDAAERAFIDSLYED